MKLEISRSLLSTCTIQALHRACSTVALKPCLMFAKEAGAFFPMTLPVN